MPLTIFLVLGILQLAAIQQARLMTSYAAFQAARAGIVWNGNNERMHDAALWALLPTLGRTDGLPELGRTWARSVRLDGALHEALLPGLEERVPDVFRAAGLLGMVRVDTLNPADHPAIGTLWNVRGGPHWRELDFDGPDSLPESPELEQHVARFLDLSRSDPGQAFHRRATVLTVRLRYLYELKVPFANWILFTSWFAANAGRDLHGGVDRARLDGGNVTSSGSSLDALATSARGLRNDRGLPTVTAGEMGILWRIATGEIRLGREGAARRFFLPLTSTYSLRMQSAFHRKWLMHEAPAGEP